MVQWEFLEIEAERRIVKINGVEVKDESKGFLANDSRPERIAYFQQLGREGWEFVQVVPGPYSGVYYGRYFFKRLKPTK